MDHVKLILLLVAFSCLSCVVTGTISVVQVDYTNWYRPCSLTDLSCIRNYFTSNGWCSSVRAPVQNPSEYYKINNVKTELTCVNATMYSDMVVAGLQNGVVSELYINLVTNSLVLSINFTDIEILQNITFYNHLYDEEDLVIVVPDATESYSSFTTTTITYNPNQYRGSNTHTSAWLDDIPSLTYPGFEDVTDTDALAFLASIPDCVYCNTQSLQAVRAELYAAFYIKNVICKPYCGCYL